MGCSVYQVLRRPPYNQPPSVTFIFLSGLLAGLLGIVHFAAGTTVSADHLDTRPAYLACAGAGAGAGVVPEPYGTTMMPSGPVTDLMASVWPGVASSRLFLFLLDRAQMNSAAPRIMPTKATAPTTLPTTALVEDAPPLSAASDVGPGMASFVSVTIATLVVALSAPVKGIVPAGVVPAPGSVTVTAASVDGLVTGPGPGPAAVVESAIRVPVPPTLLQ
ncbi:hypothetical protein CTA1_7569 [Colletotrichum tanaceti]|uniref:Uncharacterized protein n=1 Tax=Colletotrichum tanaceti TaxID=1306861 RepID=A0A4U6XQZ2_9PEZI|nr:hypothetical protein CTA1_7569 [Colletotrichum tanaceti]